MKKAVFFDLDGTLLGMDMDAFVKSYLSELCRVMVPRGYDKDTLVATIWKGTEAMVRNDGAVQNSERFWQVAAAALGERVRGDVPLFDKFYTEEFHRVREQCAPDDEAAVAAVRAARDYADMVVLSTNPIFPRCAVESRLAWLGLRPEDFDYITTYDNSSFCKPNPHYYYQIMENLQLAPEEIIMVGNDMQEDILASRAAGIQKQYFVTDHIINRDDAPVDVPGGTLREFPAWLKGQ